MFRRFREHWLHGKSGNRTMEVNDSNHPVIFHESSVTKMGDFLKFLVTNFITKIAKKIGNFLGYFVNLTRM